MNPETQTNKHPYKKVLVETWGCQMNVADSEQMLGMLKDNEYQVTTDVEEADLVLLNTCHIREKARHKVVSRLGKLNDIRTKKNPNMKVAVAGCVAQAEGRKLMEQARNIDVLVGPGKIDQLVDLLKVNHNTGKKQLAVGFKDKDNNQAAPALKSEAKVNPTITGRTEVSRFINISQGCDNFCTFCVVPFTRGREISLTPSKVADEARVLVESGAKEITLLGQNVNSYGLDLVEAKSIENTEEGPFVDLLAKVAKTPGLARLRFTTSNPHDFTRPLADLFKKEPKLGKYIHLPVQSGDNQVLERMKRKVTVSEYHERIAWLKEAVPDIAISTDLIVGFPGETEEQFENTLKLIRKVRFSFVYAFSYSTRKGTAAARFKDQIPKEVKEARLKRLMDLQNEITTELNLEEIGKTRKVLCHYESQKEEGVYYGRTEHFRLVRIPSSRDLVGQIVEVQITAANKTALVGSLI